MCAHAVDYVFKIVWNNAESGMVFLGSIYACLGQASEGAGSSELGIQQPGFTALSLLWCSPRALGLWSSAPSRAVSLSATPCSPWRGVYLPESCPCECSHYVLRCLLSVCVQDLVMEVFIHVRNLRKWLREPPIFLTSFWGCLPGSSCVCCTWPGGSHFCKKSFFFP